MKISKIVIGSGPVDTHIYDQDGKELENIMAFNIRGDINKEFIECTLEVITQETEIQIAGELLVDEKVAIYRIGSEYPYKFIRGEKK